MELNEYLSDAHKKRKKRRYEIFMGLFFLFIGLVVVALAWLLLRSPLFRVNRIIVTGNSAIPDADVVTFAQSAFGAHGHFKFLGIGNMLAWPSSFASSDFIFAPQIAEATLTKDYAAGTIRVAIEERQPFAIWCAMHGPTDTADADCYWFDATGDIFARAFDAEGSLILAVHDYSQSGLGLETGILPSRFIPNMISILNVLSASGLRIKEIRLNDIGLEEIQVTTYDGPDIYFSLRFPADDTLSVLQNLMTKPDFSGLQYVDFRTEDRAFYQ